MSVCGMRIDLSKTVVIALQNDVFHTEKPGFKISLYLFGGTGKFNLIREFVNERQERMDGMRRRPDTSEETPGRCV